MLLFNIVSIEIDALLILMFKQMNTLYVVDQLAGAVEYTDCFSAEGSPPANKCPGYDTKQSDGEVPVMLELWGMWSTSLLPLLPGPLWPLVVAPDKGPIYESNGTKPWFLEFTIFCI